MTTSSWWESVPLHEALLICAGQHASAAYEIQDDDDPRAASFAAARASAHAGAAVELLAKSLLASEHLALIMKEPADAGPAKKHPLELDKTADASSLQGLLCRHLGLAKPVEGLGAGIRALTPTNSLGQDTVPLGWASESARIERASAAESWESRRTEPMSLFAVPEFGGVGSGNQ